jgi:hypothetical protein
LAAWQIGRIVPAVPHVQHDGNMATSVGLVHLRMRMVQAASLKDKRRVLKSFKDRLRNTCNVSVAEVGSRDDYRFAVLAVAMAGSDRRYLEGALQRIVNAAAAHRDMLLIEHETEWL